MSENTNTGNIDWSKLRTPAMIFAENKGRKLALVSTAFSAHCKGAFACSYGWPMQFGEADIQKMEGAIRLLEADESQAPYVVDAEDELHTGVTIADMRAIQLEMMQHYAAAYLRKQQLRAEISDCTTQAELDAIDITWEAQNNADCRSAWSLGKDI